MKSLRMGLSKMYSILFVVIILLLQGLSDGKSISRAEEVLLQRNKVKDFVHGVIIEFGNRVGALELPEERSGLRLTGVEETHDIDTKGFYVYNRYWHRK